MIYILLIYLIMKKNGDRYCMKNELALSGEKIREKVYPDLFENIGMIRGEYIIRELNKSILEKETREKITEYLDGICSIYAEESVWYRLSELTVSEANVLEGTKEILEDRHPLFGLRGLRRFLRFKDEFDAELEAINNTYEKHTNLSIFLPFVNDSEQLSEAISIVRDRKFMGNIGCMIELPSAYFDLENILNTGINKIVIGMNDLTSFVFGTVRENEWHKMNGKIMMKIITDIQSKAEKANVKLVVAGYLSKEFVQTLNSRGITCVVHYNLIPKIFDKWIENPHHLENIKKVTKEKIEQAKKKR